MKLYVMVGFPWESEDDLRSIRDVIAPFRAAGFDINLSVSPFTPKPHTPFQWLPMDDETVLNDKILLIKDALKKTGVRVRYRDTSVSIIEGIVARADENLSPLFEYLHEHNVRLEAWREFFSFEPYRQWFEENSIDMGTYTGQIGTDSPLAWDAVDMGFDTLFLKDELRKAESADMTEDCLSGCAQCGLECHRGERHVAGETSVPQTGPPCNETKPLVPAGPAGKKVTFRYGKYGDARYVGHLDTMSILVRAIKASGVPIRTRGKYHPLPKIVLTDALPVGIESFYEFIEIEIDSEITVDNATMDTINTRLMPGIKMYEFIEGSLKDVVKDYLFILVAANPQEGDITLWKKTGGRYFYMWRGKGVKQLWHQGTFSRIIKIGSRQNYGI